MASHKQKYKSFISSLEQIKSKIKILNYCYSAFPHTVQRREQRIYGLQLASELGLSCSQVHAGEMEHNAAADMREKSEWKLFDVTMPTTKTEIFSC
jgi:hypothetical protein